MIARRTFLAIVTGGLLAAPLAVEVINLKAARALGLTIPPPVLLRATEVIQ